VTGDEHHEEEGFIVRRHFADSAVITFDGEPIETDLLWRSEQPRFPRLARLGQIMRDLFG
jgi:hypothetical protein